MKTIPVLFLVILLITGCQNLIEVKETRELMGTIVTITVIGQDKEDINNIIEKAFKEIGRIENLLSNYNNSEVYFLNKDGFINNPSNDLLYNLRQADYYSELSDGAFDITVQPILDLYTNSFSKNKRPPTEEEINAALKLVNYKNIIIDKKNIKLKNNNMKITLGGIAKGYAIDRVVDILESNGIKHALINAGGDIRAIGKKDGGWQIALENPRNKEEYITIIKLNNNAVATSGDYERFFDPEKKFHHIVNPQTGYSATELISVTIIADKAIDADALATAVFVLGKKGINLIENLDGVEALIITKDREIVKSSGFGFDFS